MINRKLIARLAGLGIATVAALGFCATGAANADTFVPLPGAHLTKTLSDGTVVDITLSGESANINPSMGATPLHRNAWVSGTASVELSGPGVRGGRIAPGYVVGCQVNIAGGGANSGVTGTLDWSDGQNVKPGVGTNSGANLTLGPGQAKSFFLLDLEQADDFGQEAHRIRHEFKGPSGGVSWADETIDLNGCAGYAQARSFVGVEVETANVVTWVTVWGEPFSIG
ncbi:MspA family porin [Nocardia sp. CA-129566]|uniref:MspA family porin n=1 Tax=Nocardia sp. CA-129566 TaxID=3239976 RepID=UPI003D988E78